MTGEKWTSPAAAEDITPEILAAAEGVYDGWYADVRIDWEDFLDRMDGTLLDDGTCLDMGADMGSAAILAVKAYVRRYAKS